MSEIEGWSQGMSGHKRVQDVESVRKLQRKSNDAHRDVLDLTVVSTSAGHRARAFVQNLRSAFCNLSSSSRPPRNYFGFAVARESQDRPRSPRSKLLYDPSAEAPSQLVDYFEPASRSSRCRNRSIVNDATLRNYTGAH